MQPSPHAPVEEPYEASQHGYPEPELARAGWLEAVHRLEGLCEGQRLIEEVGKDPEFVPKYPHEKEQQYPNEDGHEDDDQQCHREVPKAELLCG